jgi:hypothetical protein
MTPEEQARQRIDAMLTTSGLVLFLSVKNPNGGEEIMHRSQEAIMDEIAALAAESAEVLAASGDYYEKRWE